MEQIDWVTAPGQFRDQVLHGAVHAAMSGGGKKKGDFSLTL
jgi:hypothetical protein